MNNNNFQLVVSSLEEERVYSLISGKNIIGSNSKCSSQIELPGIKPQHFELLVHKDMRFTLIPQTGGLKYRQKNRELVELEPNECYELVLKQIFFIEKLYSCYIQEKQRSKIERIQKENLKKERIAQKQKIYQNKNRYQSQFYSENEGDQVNHQFQDDLGNCKEDNKEDTEISKELTKVIYQHEEYESSCNEQPHERQEQLNIERIQTENTEKNYEATKKKIISRQANIDGYCQKLQQQQQQEIIGKIYKQAVIDGYCQKQEGIEQQSKQSTHNSSLEIRNFRKDNDKNHLKNGQEPKRRKVESEEEEWILGETNKKQKINEADDASFLTMLRSRYKNNQRIDKNEGILEKIEKNNSNLVPSSSNQAKIQKPAGIIPTQLTTAVKSTNNLPRKRIHRICLSNCSLTEDQKAKMISLGCEFIDDVNTTDCKVDFDVLVMDEFRRRTKLLVALNKSIAIVSKNWILDCLDDSELIQDIHLYFLPVSQEQSKIYNNLNLDSIQQDIYNNHFQQAKKIFANQVFFLAHSFKHVKQADVEAVIVTGGGIVVDDLQVQIKHPAKLFYLLEYDEYQTLLCRKDADFYADPEYVLLSALHQQLQLQFIFKE